MHDVTLHFGDLQRDWAKFPNAAWGMALKLIMRYYDQEKPLPDDLDELEYVADVATEDDRRLLSMVLKRAFVHDPSAKVYRQKRCDQELLAYQSRRDAAALSNVKKEARRNPAKWPENIQELTLETFLAHRSTFQDPITWKLRYAPQRLRSAPFCSVSEVLDTETEPFDPSKQPFLGNLSPSLPPSLSPSLPDTPIAPKGAEMAEPSAEDFEPETDPGEQMPNTLAQHEVAGSAKKKKGAAGELAMPADWSEARRETMQRWLDYKAERGSRYKPQGWQALCSTLAGLPDKALAECVTASMANNWAGLFPDRISSPPSGISPAKKEGAAVASTAPAAPEGWQQGWVGSYGDIPCPEAWHLLSAAQKADVRGWLSSNATTTTATEGTDAP